MHEPTAQELSEGQYCPYSSSHGIWADTGAKRVGAESASAQSASVDGVDTFILGQGLEARQSYVSERGRMNSAIRFAPSLTCMKHNFHV